MRKENPERQSGVFLSSAGRLLAGSPWHRRLVAVVLAGVVAAAWPGLALAFQTEKPRPITAVRPVAKKPGTDKTVARKGVKAGEQKGTKKGATPVPTGAKPVIFAAEPNFDFGVQWVGPELKHSFKLENKGDAVLNITKVRPACGCTVAGTYPKTLAPGESGQFPFSLKSTKLRGKFKKAITITTNDPVNPSFKLSINGEVKRYVDVKPTTANFGRIAGDEAHERVLIIQNNTESPLEITLPKIDDTRKFAYELKETVPGKTFELRVSAKPPYKTGSLRETFVLNTNVDKQKTVDIPVSATIPERLDVQPKAINIVKPRIRPGAPAANKPLKRMLRFTNYGKTPVEIIEGTVDHPDVKVTITESQKGKKYNIQVQMPANFDPSAKGRTLTLKTTDKETPVITIPIRKPPERTAKKRQPRPAEKMVGKKAPAFELTTTTGQKFNAENMKDSITVLNFFAANCPHCKKQIPKIEKIRKEYEAKGVRFVLVSETMRNKRYTEEQVVDITKQIGSHVELAMDPDNKVGPLFKATSFPTLVMVGKGGKIDAVAVGNAAGLESNMRKQLDAMIAGKKVPQFTAKASKPRTRPALELLGKAAPAFEIQTLAGKVASNSDFAKHPATVLNFVAPNCGYCKKQVPSVEKVRKDYEAKGVRFVNVVQKMRKVYTEEAALDIFKGVGSHLEFANDMKENKIGKSFKAISFPTMFVVGKNGTVEAVTIGAKKDLESTLRTQLDTLISGKSLVKAAAKAPQAAKPSPITIKKVGATPSVAPVKKK